MTTFTVYARLEPTNDDWDVVQQNPIKPNDVAIYRDRECTNFLGRFPWHHSGKPKASSKTVTLNCYNWSLEWVAPKETAVLRTTKKHVARQHTNGTVQLTDRSTEATKVISAWKWERIRGLNSKEFDAACKKEIK